MKSKTKEVLMRYGPMYFLFLLGTTVACAGCSDDETTVNQLHVDAVSQYAMVAEKAYSDSVSTAQALQTAVDAFVDAPSATTLQAAKDAWLASREPYLQTEVYRFYEGPIDNETDGPEGLLNAWPMDENHIDYTLDANGAVVTSGLINDASFEINEANLESKNEDGGEKNIATGYHAIEFLLWGQDLSDTGPGDRPFTDFVTDGSGTAENQDRRGLYLKTSAALLVKHLQQVHDQWKADGAYRQSFTSGDPKLSLEKILTGMIVLAGFETGGERLQAALDSQDREDEHSCFSDNTHRDMIQDIQGIQNVFLGSYSGTMAGVGMKDVIAEVDSATAASLETEIADALAKGNDLVVPFEAEIAPGNTEGNNRVQALIDSLTTVEASLQSVFGQMNFEVPADALEFE